MKKLLKSIVELWNEFEASLDQPQVSKRVDRITAIGNDGSFFCIADCTPEFAGKVAAYLLNTFSDTPANSVRMRRAMMVNLGKAAAQK